MRSKSFKKDEGFLNFFWEALEGGLTDWQTARSVNQAPLRHLKLGIWKWRPQKSVVNFENPVSLPPLLPALKVRTVGFLVFFLSHLSFLSNEALAFKTWLTTLWVGARMKFNLHLSLMHPSAVRSERQKSEVEGLQSHSLWQLLSSHSCQNEAYFLYPNVGGQELRRCTQQEGWERRCHV